MHFTVTKFRILRLVRPAAIFTFGFVRCTIFFQSLRNAICIPKQLQRYQSHFDRAQLFPGMSFKKLHCNSRNDLQK